MNSNMHQLLTDSATGLRALADALELIRDTNKSEAKNVQPELFTGPTESEDQEVVPALSLVDVRKVLAEKSRDGHTERVRELLIKYGADKLSELDQRHYPALLKDAACLGATLDDIQGALKSLEGKGYADQIKGIFAHHYATSLEDLKEVNYAGFLRDIKELDRE